MPSPRQPQRRTKVAQVTLISVQKILNLGKLYKAEISNDDADLHENRKAKCTLVQALRLCTGITAHRGSRVIALLFLDHDKRRV